MFVDLSLLTEKEVVQVASQDPLGYQGRRISS
jgi:hypothetical protein